MALNKINKNMINGLPEELDSLTEQLADTNTQLKDTALNIRSFGAALDGVTDDTQALIDAHDALPSAGGRIYLPSTKCLIKGIVNFTKPVVLQGSMIPTLNQSIGSIILLSGIGEIVLRGEGSGVENVYFLGDATHTKNGVNFLCARPWGRNIMTGWVGQDGIVIGSETEYANVNSFHFQNLRIKDSGRHGLYIVTKAGSAPDANTGMIIGADIAGHTSGNPVQISNAHMNTFLGIHCENNQGVDNNSVNIVNSNGNMFINLYTEGQGGYDIALDVNSKENKVLGMRSGVFTTYQDLGANNIIIKRHSDGIETLMGKLNLKETGINNPDISGTWNIAQNGTNRNLEIKLGGTSVGADIDFTSTNDNVRLVADKLKLGNNSVSKFFNNLGTITIGIVNAHSTKDVTRTVTGVSVGDIVQVAPMTGIIPDGIMVYAYVSEADKIKIRFANVTATNITVADSSYKTFVYKTS